MSDTPASPKTCPKCGAALPSAATSGLCPRCLMAEAMLPTQAGSTSSSPGKALTPAELAPHFPQLDIVECLGRGGMGVVYKARQKSLNRFVALKLLAPERVADTKFAQRFTHEAQALAALNHPNIVTIYDFGQAGGFYFLLMEFVDGVNLRQAMKAGRFTPEQALAIVPPVCEALQYAHEHGIVHRDIKPENLLLDKEGRVKIADFGIAKMLGGDATAASPNQPQTESSENEGTLASAAGTPQYMAPEQKEHRVTDHRADIYSLGVVLYELLTGELPADKLQPPSYRSRGMQIDVRLDEIVLRALEKTPELRYQTAGEFRTQVETIAGSAGVPPVGSRVEDGTVAGTLPYKPGIVRIVEIFFDITFTSPLAIRLIKVSAFGFLAFLGYLPLPGMKGFFGFSGLFGLIGVAFMVESVKRHKPRREPDSASGGMVRQSRFSRMAIWAALWVVVLPFGLALNTFAALFNAELPRHSVWRYVVGLPGLVLIVVGLAGILGTTMLGWIAVAQIRRSAGKLHGLWLAVFAGLFFPLLALDALIIAADLMGRTHIVGPGLTPGVTMAEQNIPGSVILLLLAVIIVVDFLIIRAVWRAVNKGLANDSAATRPFFNTPRDYLALGCVALSGILGAMSGMTGWSRMMALPILLFALLGIVLALPLRKSWAGRSAFGAGILNVAFWLIIAAVTSSQHSIPAVSHFELASSRSRFPHGAHISRDHHSVYVVHDDVDLHYVFYYAGDFDTLSTGSQNERTGVWQDSGSIRLRNGRTFGYHRESDAPSHVHINGIDADLSVGRVIVLRDDGTPIGTGFSVPLSVALDPPALAKLIANPSLGQLAMRDARLFFGPTIEREVKHEAAIDFDSGKQATMPEFNSADKGFGGISERVAAGATWMEQQGMDALFEGSSLNAFGMKVRALNKADSWDAMTPSELGGVIGGIDPKARPQVLLAPGKDGPAAYAFQTREGGRGILQVLALTENGVKLRYRLIVSDANAAVSPPGSYRVAMLPKQQLVKSETALQKLNSKVAAQEAEVKAGAISAAEWQATKDKAGALNGELKRFSAEWSKFEAVIERHKASGVSQGEFKRAQNAVGTAEVRLRAVHALAEHDTGSATFGPAQERFVPANDESPWPWFDVDGGKVIVTLHGDDEDVADFCASMTQGYRSLSTADETGFGTIALEAAQWETMTPSELALKLKTATVDAASAEGPLPKTYGFTTRAGSMGVLQIIGIGDRPRGINTRYKLAQGSETKAAAVVKPPIAEATPTFGPVMERVLPSGVPCRAQYFQFRSGEVFIVGNGPGTSKEEAAYDEKKIDDAGGVDLSAGSGEEGIQIVGRGCIFTRDVRELKWDSFTAEQVADSMKRVSHVEGVVKPRKKDFPVTYLFKTARGEAGIMEVLGVVDDKRDGWIEKGMKFRYKLVQGAGASTADVTPPLVFGPETRGLQAAVDVTPGEPFKLRIHVRNASDHGISIDGASYRQEDECLLVDAQGQLVPVTKVAHDIKMGMKGGYFGAGQVAVFESAGLSFQDIDKAPASAGYVAKATPGRYTLRFRLRLPGDDVPFAAGEHAWKGELETGPVTIEVREPSTQAVAPVADSIWSAILGPIVERVVNDLQITRENCALSFDSGKLLPVAADITLDTLTNPSAQPAAVAWARENQVDAVAFATTDAGKIVKCGLLCPGLVVLRANNKEWVWDSADPQSLKEDFERAMREWKFIPQIAEVTSDEQFPANYLILDTRTHRRGVLQIVGVADNPGGVKIRYRMVEGAAVKKKAL